MTREDALDRDYRAAERSASEALEARHDAAERLSPIVTTAIRRAVAVAAHTERRVAPITLVSA